MPNRLIFSLRFSTKIFIKLGLLALAMIIFMTLFRMNLFFLSVFHAAPDAVFVEIFQSFVAGFRFDLLVFGFVFIPLYFVILIQALMQKWPQSLFVFYKIYFGVVWFLICALSFVDFFHFARFGERMRFRDYSAWTPQTLVDQAQGLQANQFWFFATITVILFFLGFTLTKGIKFGDWKDEFSPKKAKKREIALRTLIPLILIALAARGTVEPHHLALEHSDVSNIKAINEMALNAVWCFDK